ncbi:Serine/threonine-protein kinase PknB [Phycisphaerae bacterium RAS1]|nr:Serine/threonine-protein kinase PknB [Phycisphaerae bacterium RAS1]
MSGLPAPQRIEVTATAASGDAPSAVEVEKSVGAESLPGYTIVGEIHRGGQGVVYKAVQKSTRRNVAIKVMHEGPLARPSDRVRFEREIQVLGQLNHPNIVGIHDSGTAAGCFYYVMDFIPGQPLDRFVQTTALPVRRTLELFGKICDAINAAHLRGVIHRDIKPGNIRIDEAGEPHVLDFGLAKLTEDNESVDSKTPHMTMTGQFIGSVPWASPEQAEGRQDDVDIRTDVYSLGVVLYQMLTVGTFPYDVGGNMRKVIDNILNVAPTPPSRHRPEIDDEVETIVLKCLSKEPPRRYQSAGELANDIRRYLAGQPIEAKRDSGWYMLRKGIRRYWAAASIAAVMLVAGVGFGVAMTFLYQQAAAKLQARERAEAVAAREAAEERERLVARRLYGTRVALAGGKLDDGDVALVRDLLIGCPQELRGWEWQRLDWLADRSRMTLRGHDHFVSAVAWRSGGKQIASAGFDGTVRLWTQNEAGEFAASAVLKDHDRPVMCAEFSPDGKTLASGGQDRVIRLWDAATGEPLRTLEGHWSHVAGLAWRSDGGQLASVGHDGTLRIWHIATGDEPTTLYGHEGAVDGVAYSPDGATIATAGEDGTVRLWDAAHGAETAVLRGHEGRAWSVAFDPEGRRLASGGSDGTIRIWGSAARPVSAENGAIPVVILTHGSAVHGVAWSPDGRRVASGGEDRALRVWDAGSGACAVTLRGHAAPIDSVAFSPGGASIASGGRDNTLRVWDAAAAADVLALAGHHSAVHALAVSPDGRFVASGGRDFTVKLWDAATGQELRTGRGHEWTVTGVAFTPDGASLVSVGDDGRAAVWNAATLESLRTWKADEEHVFALAVSPQGRVVASGGFDDRVHLWDVHSGADILALSGHSDDVLALAFSPDGKQLASCSADRTVRVWAVASGRCLATLAGHEGRVTCVTFMPDGRSLASGADDTTIRIWRLGRSDQTLVLRGHRQAVRSLACLPDGERLVSGGDDGAVKLWDTVTGEELQELRESREAALAVAVGAAPPAAAAQAPASRSSSTPHANPAIAPRIVAGGSSGVIRVWETAEPLPDVAARRAHVAAAHQRVDAEFAAAVFADDVIGRLRERKDLESALRATAIEIVQARGNNPQQLNDAAWTLVKTAGRPAAEYRRALRMAETACDMSPRVGSYLNTLGIARFRCGRYAEALETLAASRARNGEHPADVAFAAMSLQKLGRSEEAARELVHLRELMGQPWFARDELWQQFLREAEKLAMDAAAQ